MLHQPRMDAAHKIKDEVSCLWASSFSALHADGGPRGQKHLTVGANKVSMCKHGKECNFAG